MSSANFGQNEWLVDEMYQQYKQNPQSVDADWREFFEKNGSKGASDNQASAPQREAAGNTSTQSVQPSSQSATKAPTAKAKQAPVDGARNKVARPIPPRVAPPAPRLR